ncbi:MAG: sigma 54-interacting transcriptional regulator [Labilithrix sp.]|nr:sigma 54-interacting transcriptional regulator [Labilithrix sp.]
MKPGTRIAHRYVVEAPLGEGGLASAFRVRDLALDVDLALKLVDSEAASRDLLRREFLALRAVTHPRIVRVHDFGYWRDRGEMRAFYTSPIVEGGDLRRYAERRSWRDLVGPVGDVLSALASLHRRGLVHGDLHPGNVLVGGDGRAVLIDLSCSRPFAGGRASDVSGTPGFIAPELLRGIVHRSADLFALGVTLRSLGVALPGPVARAVDRLAAERPDDRPGSVEEAAELLGAPWARPPASDLLGSRLVGRDDALGRARAVVDAIQRRASGPRVVALQGDDGVGRTRLLEELKAEAQLEGDALLASGRRPGAIGALLALALGEDVDLGSPTGALRAASRLSARREPLVLLVDDADELSAIERERLVVLSRALPDDGNVAVIVASKAPIVKCEHVAIELTPLDRRDVETWLGAEIPAAALGEIVRATAGYPKEIAALLAQLDGAAWDSRVLARAVASSGVARGEIELGDLDDDARATLAAIVAAGVLDAAPSPALESLAARGLVAREPDGVRLLRRSDTARVAGALGEPAMKAAHRALAEQAAARVEAEPRRADLRAAWIVHLAQIDPARAASALVLAPPSSSGVDLRRAADALVAVGGVAEPRVIRRCAEIYAESGEPARALALVARGLARRPGHDERVRLRQIAGQCYAQTGDSKRAVSALRRLLPDVVGRPEHARVAAALSLALLKRGADTEALAVVQGALAGGDGALAVGQADEAGTRLDLLLNAAFATSRAGSLDEARASLVRAREIAGRASPRGRFRLASATAFVEYGAGETPLATRAYKEALELAEEHGLDDVVASAALNYGAACHEQGDLGRALDAYARGRRLAVALAMPTTEVTLSFNLAKVYADIGSHERARFYADATLRAARRERMTLLEAGASAVLAEVASLAGEHRASAQHLDDAERLIAGAGDREAVDLALQRARALVSSGDRAGAARALAACEAKVRALATRDAEAAWLGIRAASAIAEGRPADATLDLERALGLAESSGQRGLVADLEAKTAEAFAAADRDFLSERHAARAREIWERTLASLPDELHDAFRRHPSRAKVFAPAPRASAPERVVEAAIDVRRILEINRRLNSATTTNAVLEEAMDAAISLTNAERGFLLVRVARGDGGGEAAARGEGGGERLRVTVARNVDRETLRKGHLKFSRTVAERVVQTGEPVIAVDAAFDPRFVKARSVHAMKLKSLLCVPIRSPDGILGAIYVDHRFFAGGFRPELVDVLLALGDQAALALEKARLVEELRVKSKVLEEQNAEIERLARGQALEIARLKRTIEADEHRSAAVRPRFDYSGIVATSLPMRRVFGVLDRVIDADVTVLVRGESGTGKERIARAIHDNSARAREPFVAINCGALPETLLEAELFGYERGAFSGATRDHPGLFVSARGGTLFLDELGEMPASMQVKLLRVLQEHEVRPLGANEAVATDVRLVCATNRVLAEEVRAGRFREDLYYRVAVVEIELPPLRERIEDVLPIAEAILARLATELGRPRATLDRSGERALLAHAWPGNVRELENVLTKAFLLAQGSALGVGDLDLGAAGAPARGSSVALRARIVATLEETDWNVVLTSQLLGMPRATLYRKMRRFGLVRPARS